MRRRHGTGLLALALSAVTLFAAPTTAGAATPDELAGAKQRLDALAEERGAPPAVSAWWVDAATSTVVLALNAPPGDAGGAAWVDEARAVHPAVRVVDGVAAPTPRAGDLVGGDATRLGADRCAAGFSARTASGAPRLVTAGHCTNSGGDVAGADGVPIGPVRSSVFDRTGDWGVIDVGPGRQVTAAVAAEGATLRAVTGTATAAVGAPVCRSGATTGWRCGVVTAVDVTANYAAGPVQGLVLTTACSEAGDSGGPFVAGGSALGVLSGGTGDCTSAGGTSLYQPIDEVLRVEGLTLATAS